MKPTIAQVAKTLRCSEDAVRAQFRKNLATMRSDLEQARRTGKPVRGYSAQRIASDVVAGREQRVWKLPPGPDRWKLRSMTYQGVANAMAAQWMPIL
jgi:hypothetical protein